MAVLGCGACAQLGTFADLCNVRDAQWQSISRGHHDLLEALSIGDLARHANQILLARALDVAGADVGVVASHGIEHVAQRQPIGEQLGWVRGNVELTHIAADSVDLGDALQVTQLWPYDPILQGAKRGRRPGLLRAILGLNRVHEDLTQPRRYRSQAGFDANG